MDIWLIIVVVGSLLGGLWAWGEDHGWFEARR